MGVTEKQSKQESTCSKMRMTITRGQYIEVTILSRAGSAHLVSFDRVRPTDPCWRKPEELECKLGEALRGWPVESGKRREVRDMLNRLVRETEYSGGFKAVKLPGGTFKLEIT